MENQTLNTPLPSPVIILVRPQMGENIGAAARVMANFGLTSLRLVEPRDGWPNPKATEMAAGATAVIEGARIFPSTAAAVADLHRIAATTARTRQMEKPVADLRDAVRSLHEDGRQAWHTGILFGPERTGLSNEDLALADTLLTIPVNPGFTSLNLAQAVAVTAYEWFASSPKEFIPGAEACTPLATKAEIQALFDHLETALDAGNFWRVPEKKEAMWHHIRAMLQRGNMSGQEVRTYHGMIRCLRDFKS